MYQLKIGTIPLPKIYVCKPSEADKCRDMGVPYIIKPERWSDERLVKAVLFSTLVKKFRHINWRELFGFNWWDLDDIDRLKVQVPHEVEVSSTTRTNSGFDTCGRTTPDLIVTKDKEYRETAGGMDADDTMDFESIEYENTPLDNYIGDIGYHVNIEELQALKLLPTFMDDIANAIKLNLMNTAYMDGYNKKLECNLGSWQGTDQAPNLIVLDTSGSIPSGVAGTMISLIDTLRHQANADLIITSGRSEYWPANTELPDPDKLSYLIGGCNECVQFYAILRKHILGKHWGNVIVFGDYDSPLRNDIVSDMQRRNCKKLTLQELQSTRIDRIMAFHTRDADIPGYGLWASDAAPKAEVVYNTDWVEYMKRY